VLRNNGKVPGYWNFTTGLRMDYERTGDPVSRNAVVTLSENAAYTPDITPLTWTQGIDRSREVAYAILSYVDAEAVGRSRRPRRAALVNQAYGHLDQWFGPFVWVDAPGWPVGHVNQQMSPFMVGLTAHALIRDWEQTDDQRLLPALTQAANWLWSNAWIPSKSAMWYEAAHPTNAAPDLNLLIAPMYAFLFHQTGNPKYRDEGDALFAGGIKQAFLVGAKQFNQNYWWSFDYIKWRAASRVSP
jgi:hypothetical protein